MGNSASYEDDLDRFDGIETLGYRVLGVQPNSPASKAGLVSFFDFLVGADEKMLLGSAEGLEEGDEYDDVDFVALLQEFTGKPLELLVWNIKAQEKRFVTIVPSNDWGGAGLLGVTIRIDNYGGADERLIRVLEIEKNSPAAIAGLVPLQDYLLGTTTQSLEDTASLAEILQQHADRVVELYVYNTTSDVVRIVALMPTLSWGGKGLLGAEVGTGYLHRLPMQCRGTIGNSVERKVVARRPGDGPVGKTGDFTMAPQLEMEPEPGQAHAMPMPELKASIPPEKTVPVSVPVVATPPVEPEAPEQAVEPLQPEPPAGAPELTGAAPAETLERPVAEKPETAPEPQVVPPPPPPAQPVPPPPAQPMPPPPAQPVPPPPAQPMPPPPPPPEASTPKPTVAIAYTAPTASTLFPGPPAEKPPAPAQTYASAFLPPPPMSHLSKQQDEVDLR